MMPQLELLTTTQATDYVNSLDLREGTEAYRTLNAMMLLSQEAFLQALSGLAHGLITLGDLRALPAMNDRLVGDLIAARLGVDDLTTLAWYYRTRWLPASVDVQLLRRSAIGNVRDYLAARAADEWSKVLRPRYDFLGADQTAYFSYTEAYNAYMRTANGAPCADLVWAFESYHERCVSDGATWLPVDGGPVLEGVRSLLTSATFLERPEGGRAPSPILDWVVNGTFLCVAPSLYERFMREAAYPAMAATVVYDHEHSGLAGARALLTSTSWPTLEGDDIPWQVARARLARVHLPAAYGTRASETLAEDRATEAAVLAYLQAAKAAFLDFRAALGRTFPSDASTVRILPGSPLGLLLTLTTP